MDGWKEQLVSSKEAYHSNLVAASNIPRICQEESCILGVDEAGRGPVLGPMVYAVSFCPLSKKEEFANIGFDDSKVLTEKKREDLFALLCNLNSYAGWAVDIISPNYISNSMLKRSKRSLNEVAENSTVNLVQRSLNLGIKVSEIYVDTVGPPEKYREKLQKYFPDCKITVAKKADSLFPIVSAASICAKVTRDRVISHWKFTEHLDNQVGTYGSGYPNDPATKSFLTGQVDTVFGFPHLVRFSWSTAEKLLEKDGIHVEWENEEEGTARKAKKFFTSPMDNSHHSVQQLFFKENEMVNTISF